MSASLIVALALMGLAGTPHCAAMCSAPCAALVPRGGCGSSAPRWTAFAAGRVIGYAAGGAVVAGGVAGLRALSDLAPALRVLWTAAQLVVLAAGLWMLVRGCQPQWLMRLGTPSAAAAPLPGGWRRIQGPARAAATGVAWVIVPCGWLSAALLMSALANSPIEGASAMAVFALTSMPGLFLPGLAWQRMSGPAAQARLTRLAGLALVVASGWSLTQEVWSRVGALCGLG